MKLIIKGGVILSLASQQILVSSKFSTIEDNLDDEEPYQPDVPGSTQEDVVIPQIRPKKQQLVSNLTSMKNNIQYITQQLLQLSPKSNLPKTYFIGPTGSGKSTLISYLLGVQLEVEKKFGGLQYHIQPRNQSAGSPKIGNEAKSCTSVPSIYEQTQRNIFFVDTAGFEDTSGVQMEIINSYALKELFKRGEKVKLAIVITEDSLVTKRGRDLSKIVSRVTEMFNSDMIILERSLVFVFTKVSIQEDEQKGFFDKIIDYFWSEEALMKRMNQSKLHINDLVMKIVNDNKEMSEENKSVIKKVVLRNQTMIIPKADQIDEKMVKLFQEDFNKIMTTVLTKDASISVGEEGRLYLSRLQKAIHAQISEILEQVKNEIKLSFSKEYENREKLSKQQIKHGLQTLKDAQSILLQISYGIKDWSVINQKIRQIFIKLKISQQLYESTHSMLNQYKFCKTLDSQMNNRELQILFTIKNSIDQQKKMLQHKLELLLTQQEKDRQLQEQIERIEREREEQQKKSHQKFESQKSQYLNLQKMMKQQLDELKNKNREEYDLYRMKLGEKSDQVEKMKLQYQHREKMYEKKVELELERLRIELEKTRSSQKSQDSSSKCSIM